MATVASITHPKYDSQTEYWAKYRYTYNGGSAFIDEYLVKLSARETDDDFTERKNLTYSPSHAKAALIDIKNSIFERMVDISRDGGPESYSLLTRGESRGVDRAGSSMNSFMGREVLPELLAMSRVGIYVDKPVITGGTKADAVGKYPYLYVFRTEDIRSWRYDEDGRLVSLLLQQEVETVDEVTGLVNGTVKEYRLLQLTEAGVEVTYYDKDGVQHNDRTAVLELTQIPFVIVEIPHSLLADVADYQIALLNMASTDVYYSVKSNFPFYTEQYHPGSDSSFLKNANPVSGSGKPGEAVDNRARAQELVVGVTKGRRYPKDLERPGFIHPSPEPLKASIEKQEQMKKEIRQLVNLSLSNIDPKRSSAESKEFDNHGLEAGLAYIGFVMEQAERMVASIWSEYEGSADIAVINYPSDYKVITEGERRKEAEELYKIMPTIPSITFQREIAKRISTVMLSNKVDVSTLKDIHTEIDDAEIVCVDPEILRADFEAGFVSTETASKARGYPEGEVEQAKKDHADRLARIAKAQSDQSLSNAGARGVKDQQMDPNEAAEEKAESRNTDENETTEKPVRGEGQ